MIIDGKKIADDILSRLTTEATTLKTYGIIPTLAVIQVGDDPASLAYIRQKQKAADRIGAKIILSHQPSDINKIQLKALVDQFNGDPHVHGLIIQRPIPPGLGDVSTILDSVTPRKDVDGFVNNSLFEVPVAAAVLACIQVAYAHIQALHPEQKNPFDIWLKTQCAAVIGRGDTAGKPIFTSLSARGCATSVIHSQTADPDTLVKKMVLVVSCVGKERVVTRQMVTRDTILIGVGIWRDSDGKLHGDYDEEEIKDIVAFYTPTPGGVGPVNVACLMQNLVKACTLQKGGIL